MSKHRLPSNPSLAIAGTAILAYALLRGRRILKSHTLQGKVVLITGGSRGLGFALAQQLAIAGAKLVLTARSMPELEGARDKLIVGATMLPENIFVQAADVTKPDEVRDLVDAATQRFGKIDILINNAGVIFVGPFESQKLASYQQAMNVNFFGAVHTTLAVLPQMLSRGNGAVVNIASIGGKVAFPHLLPYVASKFALTGWSQGLHAELAGKGIQVLTVSPGVMRTGSHVQARYAGDAVKEYRWFAAAASFPGTATSASTAAQKIVRALTTHAAEISIGLSALAAARANSLLPEWSATALSLVNRCLPDPPAEQQLDFWQDDQSTEGKQFRGSLPNVLEDLGQQAERKYNQEAEPLNS